nr:MAG TPA: hypothetical protein [Caudoviricetes sp.]
MVCISCIGPPKCFCTYIVASIKDENKIRTIESRRRLYLSRLMKTS